MPLELFALMRVLPGAIDRSLKDLCNMEKTCRSKRLLEFWWVLKMFSKCSLDALCQGDFNRFSVVLNPGR